MNKDKYVFAQLVAFLDNNSSVTWLTSMMGTGMSRTSPAGISSWHSCSDNSVTVRACVMLSLHWRLTNPNVITLEWGVIQ